MKNKKVLYVFGPGRLDKIKNHKFEAEEFFYSYFYIKKYFEVEIIEASKNLDSKYSNLFRFYDRLITKLTSFPSYLVEIINKNNVLKYQKADSVIFTNDALYLSFLPIIVLDRLLRSKRKITVITMGLFGKVSKNKIIALLDKIYLKSILFFADQFIFLGWGEYCLANNLYKKNSFKFHYIPFCIDTKFWTGIEITKINKREGILFIGNDGKRDFEFLVQLAHDLKEFEFTIVTNQKIECDFENVKLIKGSWSLDLLSDSGLRNLYNKSILTIIPLKESYQPSGQSVGMQSIACRTPILITKTKGFWGNLEFSENNSVNFVEKNEISIWRTKINEILNTPRSIENSESSFKLFCKNYDIEKFSKNLKELI